MRYSSSMVIAIFISLLTFLGMSYLVTSPKFNKSTQLDTIGFGMIEDMEPPKTIVKSKPKPPEQKAVKAAPALPHLDITSQSERPTINISREKTKFENIGLVDRFPPNLPTNGTNVTMNEEGDLMQILGIQPNYPSEAKRGGIEGWVKVEFIVNKYGLVSEAKVLDSKPKRIFNQATLRAIYKSKFKPLVIDGQAVAQTAVQVIEFKLEQ